MQYRPDIDGLRSLAVIPVVLFHSGFSGFSGGFIGVDIFFVISGYLITSILLKEVQDGNLSIVKFYERRARRILPAFVFMMVLVLIIGAVAFLPDDYEKLAKSALASIAFSANIYFWLSTGYFEVEAASTPLLHLWSLGVEEQYYIFFPIALLVFSKYVSQKQLLYLVAFCAVISLLICISLVYIESSFTFYMLPTRSWELLAGSILAFRVLPGMKSKTWIECLSWAGLLLIIAGVLLIKENYAFPGFWAMLPVMGAVLIIFTGQERYGLVHRLLSMRLIVYVGVISYSLYLWHWPIAVFLNLYFDFALIKYLIIALSLILAIISYHLVEQPFRRGPFCRSQASVFKWSALSILLVTIFSVLIIAADGARQRIPDEILKVTDMENYVHDNRQCHFKTLEQIKKSEFCIFGDRSKKMGIALIGDSHADTLRPAIDKAAKENDLAAAQLTSPGCRPLLGVYRVGREKCLKFIDESFDIVAQNDEIEIVFLSGYWSVLYKGYGYRNKNFFIEHVKGKTKRSLDNEAVFIMGLKASIAKLRKAGKMVVIVGDVPIIEINLPKELAQDMYIGTDFTDDFVSPKSEVNRYLKKYVESISSEYVRFIDLEEEICPDGKCDLIENGSPQYRDGDHISENQSIEIYKPFSKLIAEDIARHE